MTIVSTVGGSSSNSYVSLAEFEAYVLERGIDVGSVSDSVKEGWLIRSTEFIDAYWSGKWKGSVTAETQSLSWPRKDVVDADGREIADDMIPLLVKKATYEMAVYAKTYPNLNSYVMTGIIEEESAKAGPVEASTKYVNGSITSFPYSNVSRLLSSLTVWGMGYAKVVRT